MPIRGMTSSSSEPPMKERAGCSNRQRPRTIHIMQNIAASPNIFPDTATFVSWCGVRHFKVTEELWPATICATCVRVSEWSIQNDSRGGQSWITIVDVIGQNLNFPMKQMIVHVLLYNNIFLHCFVTTPLDRRLPKDAPSSYCHRCLGDHRWCSQNVGVG